MRPSYSWQRENDRSLARFRKDLEIAEYHNTSEARIREAHQKFLAEMDLKKKGVLPMYEPVHLLTHTQGA